MITIRSFEEIQQTIIDSFAEQNSPTTDFSIGSAGGAIVRSLATAHLELDVRLQDAHRRSVLSELTGGELDDYLGSLGFARKQGTYAAGSAVLLSNLTPVNVLANNLVFTDLSSAKQYIATNSVQLSPLIQASTSITALVLGSESNLSAGTPLFVTNLTGVPIAGLSAYVGYSQSVTGQFTGDITGGIAGETDAQYVNRYLTAVASKGYPTTTSLESILNGLPTVSKAWIRTPASGLVLAYVYSSSELNQYQIKEIKSQVAKNLTPGLSVAVVQVDPRPIDVSLSVTPYSSTNQANLLALIQAAVKSYFDTIEVGQTYDPTGLLAKIQTLAVRTKVKPGVRLTAQANQLFILDNLSVDVNLGN